LHTGGWGLGLDGEAFHTDGFVPVPGSIRGAADSVAGSDFRTTNLTLDRALSDRARVFARASLFGERRTNGTIDQGNDTRVRELEMGGDWQSETVGALAFRAYGAPEVYDQNFFSIAANRDSETLTRDQRVPSHLVGGSVQWSRPAGARQTLVAGVEGREVRGTSDEIGFTALTTVPGDIVEPVHATSAVGSGGRERTYGVFGEDIIRPTANWVVTLGVRYDHWRNYDALSVTQSLTKPGPPAVTDFPDRTEQAVSPRLAVVRRVNDHLSLNVSGYQSFRAPSLNELYRSFRLGNTLTESNANLRAERLTGAEAGANYVALNNRLVLQGSFFWSDVSRPIENVTLSETPSLITNQRQNLGRTRARGIDLEVTERVSSHFEVTGGYELAATAVLSYPANTALVGLWVPEVPRHAATLQARYSNLSAANRWARLTAALQGRMVGAQFDDSLNQFKLGRFFTLDGFVSRQLTPNLEVFVASENLLNQRYDIELTPTEMLGVPALVRAGIRVNLRSR
ncbi:MAG TPA: TonB-dependent receptor, partial [Terriglobia bacterium]|nr:TonB-dependent receptor [Terriglobia bacterium]